MLCRDPTRNSENDMPDFERPLRKLNEHLHPEQKLYHKGLDRGRWECVAIALVFAFLYVLEKT